MSETKHIQTIIPTLRYRDANAAIIWLGQAFGFEPFLVVDGENDTIAHAQLSLPGGGMIMMGTAGKRDFDAFQKPPESLDGIVTQSAYIVVADVNAHHERAVAAGAVVVIPLTSEDHGRGYSCRDLEGHVWNFGDFNPWA
jgi:uncharacterized glyoxalase superfamily protein PhnB